MAEADPQISGEAAASGDAVPAKPKRKLGKLFLMFSAPLLIIIAAGAYWYSLQGQVSTDNAYVKQDKVAVSAEVSGRLIDVRVKEGQEIEAGALLFRIDPEPYQLEIQSAQAAIAGAQANVTTLSNDSALSGADIAAAQEDIAFTRATLQRQEALWARGFTTKADLDAARHGVNEAQERLRAAQARQREARARLATGAAVPGENPQVAAARAKLATAQLNLSRAEVRAPISGQVAESDRLQPGQQVIPGLPMLTLVESRSSYVEANFKETDLADMQIGQRAEVSFDAYPGVKLKGRVSSIGAGTGSEFSVLPAQNATGNWVKVTQRVPVRITLDEKSPRQLIAGLSSHVTVFTNEDKVR
ncbi:MAG: HlyD family secretion protein [Sphingomonadaceae bacterium]|nr:HlyD family secretion protein [Sphingomonadaceae bacterium]